MEPVRRPPPPPDLAEYSCKHLQSYLHYCKIDMALRQCEGRCSQYEPKLYVAFFNWIVKGVKKLER